jgi:hypothetical protein
MKTMEPVTLKIRWSQLFGEKQSDMADETRRQRWEEWKTLCAKQPDGKEFIEWWTDCDEACLGCIHRRGDWCGDQQLPCTVSPILTFSENLKGMACMGLNYKPGQMKMF